MTKVDFDDVNDDDDATGGRAHKDDDTNTMYNHGSRRVALKE